MARRQSLPILKHLSKISSKSQLYQSQTTQSVTYMPRPGDGTPRPVTLIPGDGIGPLVTNAVEQVFVAMHAPIYFDKFPEIHSDMKKIPESLLESIRANKVCIKGGLMTPVGGGISSLNMQLCRCQG